MVAFHCFQSVVLLSCDSLLPYILLCFQKLRNDRCIGSLAMDKHPILRVPAELQRDSSLAN